MASIAGDTSVSLSWTVPSSDGGFDITDYTIEHNLAPFEDDAWTLVADGVGTDTSFDVTGLTSGETYLFRVRAVNATGPGVATVAKDSPNVVASAPTSVTVTPTGRGRLLISWTAPTSGAPFSGYAIERSLDNADFSPLTEVGGDTTSFLDTGLTRPQQYYYRRHGIQRPRPGSDERVASGVPFDVPTAPRSLTASRDEAVGPGPAVVARAAVRRWVAAHGLRRATLAQRHDRLDHGQRWRQRQHRLHRHRAVERRSAVLPGHRQEPAGRLRPVQRGERVPVRSRPRPASLTATATGVSGQVRLAWLAPTVDGGSAITDYVL